MDNEEISNESAFDQAEKITEMPKTNSKAKGIKVATPTKKVVNSYEGVKLEKTTQEEEEEMMEEEESSEEPESTLVSADFKVVVEEKSQEQREIENGIKKPMNGEILTIESVTVLPPKTQKMIDGVLTDLEPEVTQNKGAPFYGSKLKVRFSGNIVEYYPSINFWVNDGKINPVVRLDRNGNSKVSQIARQVLQKMSKNAFELETQTINERPSLVVTEKTKKAFEAFSKTVSDSQILQYLVGKKVKIVTSKGKYQGKDWFRNDFELI